MPGLIGASSRGTVRYNVLDLSVRPEDRGLFSGPAHKYSEDIEVDLFEPVSSPEIVQGPEGLDVQGFAYVKHRSALDVDEWMNGENPEETYVKEVEDLVGKVTGAKKVVVNHLGIRKRLAEKNADPSFYRKAGDKHDETVKERAKKETAWVTGKTDAGLEPARFAHVDYTLEGLKRTARYCRKDIKAAAQEALDAEDANKDAKRYAAYSVWRPLKPVKRDPLAVADWRTTEKDTLQPIEYRATSNVVDKGEYMLEQYTQTPEAKNTGQKWYCMTKQTPEDVLILKFADTASEKDPKISQYCAHCSPMLPNVDNEEPRMSVEARVIAFW
ncbi:uncharacterized protein CC84DRAFT_1235569 [Paraphaeosphaeria sporulosa]|uniref:GA4 desaturase n=1 Tax=Paraphaeosphaeria sporulosa TaxID=1460663 RepID=A0A177CR79_9PLEO|nr:uncharacterized protein CC84DRAFT_1235569 [Paraphaeosphaeria sporulosa]OAG09721.1 hypothetical protein CC84DRAFT_1235569 [Paraphaeosphaeria sporulosa]